MNTDVPHPRGSPDLCEPDTPCVPERPTSCARESLVDAALANLDIREFLADPKLGRVWTEEAMRRCPPCRNEWECVTVIATTGEAHSAAKHKIWGKFLGVLPLARDDPVHPYRILYCYKAASPYNRRVEQRRELKRILGKGYRTLVTRASRSTKKDFLRTLTADQAYVIQHGVLIDVTATAREAGIVYPTAVTAAVHHSYVRVPDGVTGQDERGRLWDMLWMLRFAVARSPEGDFLIYTVFVKADDGLPKPVKLKAICHPGDEGEPVITVLMPDED